MRRPTVLALALLLALPAAGALVGAARADGGSSGNETAPSSGGPGPSNSTGNASSGSSGSGSNETGSGPTASATNDTSSGTNDTGSSGSGAGSSGPGATNDSSGGGSPGGNGSGGETNAIGNDSGRDQNGTGSSSGESREGPGDTGFVSSGSAFRGRWLSFERGASGLSLTDLTLGGVPLLSSILVNGTGSATLERESDEARLVTSQATLSMIDASPSAITLDARSPVSLTLVPAPGASLVPFADGVTVVAGGARLDLGFHGDARIVPSADGSFTVDLRAGASAEARLAPVQGAASDAESAAFRVGKLGGEATFESTSVGTTAQVVAHGDAQMTASLTPSGVVVIVSAATHDARVFVVNLRNGTLANGSGTLRVLLDGVPVAEATNLSDVLSPNANATARFLLVTGAQGTQVIVAVPHLSTHAIVIESIAGAIVKVENDPLAFLAVAGAAGVALLAGVALVARRRGGS